MALRRPRYLHPFGGVILLAKDDIRCQEVYSKVYDLSTLQILYTTTYGYTLAVAHFPPRLGGYQYGFHHAFAIVKWKNSNMVVVDRLSKYAHFVSLPTHFTATSLAASFSKAIYKLHETFLRCFVSEMPHHEARFLHLVEYWYNSMHHSPIGMSPFQALYGRAPPAIVDYVEDAFPIAIVDEFLRHRKDVLAAAKYHLAHARHLMKLQANQHRRDCALNVGDWVILFLQPYRQKSVQFRP
ncbi:UNVERIFIED_CONTAM: hypothetical protein Sangu_3032100 [Sesamum angustifolium]|uniref:Integrase catalytic domain-containing protein n=1 Tax=Sesamum angustifolium TaxID=2727405 RepID=A0AAW2KK84_9LAMI